MCGVTFITLCSGFLGPSQGPLRDSYFFPHFLGPDLLYNSRGNVKGIINYFSSVLAYSEYIYKSIKLCFYPGMGPRSCGAEQ